MGIKCSMTSLILLHMPLLLYTVATRSISSVDHVIMDNMTSSVLRSPEIMINITLWRTGQIMDKQHTISEIS